MATKTFGRVRLTFTGGPLAGREWDVRGEVKIMGLGGSVATTANLNGTMSKSYEPKPVVLDVTVERPPEDLTLEQFLGDHDVICEEVDFGRTHFLASASMEGEVEENAKSGDLSGFKFACAKRDYRKG